jgi:putative NADH-flavin reductase
MKLAVFGGTGKTGLEVVRQAVAQGHEVTALARTPSRMTISSPHLTVLQGDAMNAEDVKRTVQGTDAIINALGHVKGSPPDLQTVVINNILAAMAYHNVRRLVTLSGGGVRFPDDRPKFIDHVFKFLLSVMSPKVLKDGERHVEVLRQSAVDWVVVRGPRLTDGPHTGSYKVGNIGDPGMSTQCSRANVADFMLKCTTDITWLCKGPFISE